MCRSPNSQDLGMWPYLEGVSAAVIKLRWGHTPFEWALIQRDQHLYKKRKLRCRRKQRRWPREDGGRNLQATESQGPRATPEAKRKAWNRFSPSPLGESSSAGDEQRQEDVGQRKNSCSERGAPLGYWDTGVHWCTLWYRGQSGAVTGNGGRRIGSSQPTQGVYATLSSLDLIHRGFRGWMIVKRRSQPLTPRAARSVA